MHADYTCECGEVVEVTYSIKDGPPKSVFCPKCERIMQREWKSAIHIPMDFADDLTTSLTHRMAHAKRPTGKDKVYY
jgi:hypothetical protein